MIDKAEKLVDGTNEENEMLKVLKNKTSCEYQYKTIIMCNYIGANPNKGDNKQNVPRKHFCSVTLPSEVIQKFSEILQLDTIRAIIVINEFLKNKRKNSSKVVETLQFDPKKLLSYFLKLNQKFLKQKKKSVPSNNQLIFNQISNSKIKVNNSNQFNSTEFEIENNSNSLDIDNQNKVANGEDNSSGKEQIQEDISSKKLKQGNTLKIWEVILSQLTIGTLVFLRMKKVCL